jgi:hypothetical protein
MCCDTTTAKIVADEDIKERLDTGKVGRSY